LSAAITRCIAGSNQQQGRNGLHPHASPAQGNTAVTVLATERVGANGTLLATAGTQTAPALRVTTSMTSKVSQGARILLRGRDEDLGIDAIGNMARCCPHKAVRSPFVPIPVVAEHRNLLQRSNPRSSVIWG